MNKQLHRVVFNAARGQRMAVHEGASSHSGRGRMKATAVAAFVALASPGQFALAQIAGDPSAPANQRPVVVTAPNGTPLVQIQTPSAGGVSRNTYRQFDIDGRGAILNNSRTQAQTQLGGWVQGNPYLANGPARIILNEVNSTHPSQLRGYVEVAGQRAEVIIANPAGIQVNGGGFINASRATLTTGTPKFNDAGSLESFLVRGGTVSIEGAGLDASKTDYAAILARAIQVNAGIWASELKVVAGANEVSADAADHGAGSAKTLTGSGAAPTFALDVAQLGGMYAGKITLIGTEAGVGVRNAGDIGAGAGGLVVRADGRLENAGTLRAARVDLKSTANIENQAGGTIEAQSLQLASAADAINRGTIRQTGSTTLTVQAPSLSNTQGGYIGAQPLPQASGEAQGGQVTPDPAGSSGASNGGQQGSPTQSEVASAPAASGTEGSSAAPVVVEPPQPGQIVAAGSVRNEGGRIYAGDVRLQTPNIDNSGGQLSVGELAVSGPRFSNAGGTLNVAKAFSAQVDRFDNAGGQLNAGQLTVKTGELDNRGGMLRAASIDIESTGDVRNGDGQLRSDSDIRIAAGGVVQSSGRITAARHLNVDAGAVQADADSVFGAGVRSDGSIGREGNLRIQASGELAAKGVITAAGDLNAQGRSVDLNGSRTSASNIVLTATQGDLSTRGASVAVSLAGGDPQQVAIGNAMASNAAANNECAHTRMCGSDSVSVEVQGNVAAGKLGELTEPTSIHLSIQIEDKYDGITVLDGQPGPKLSETGLLCSLCLNSNISGAPKGGIVWGPYPLQSTFTENNAVYANSLVRAAEAYRNGVFRYSIPSIPSGYMGPNNYNSNSWAAGVLRQSNGSAPLLDFGIFIAPGYGNPVPSQGFKK